MKKIRIISVILCFCLIFSAYTCCVMAVETDENDPTAVTGSHGLDASVSYLGSGQLVENAQAAFLYEYSSDTLMYSWNPDAPVFPSSLVKIMTAYLAVTMGNLDNVVTVSEETLAQVPSDAMSADLVAGEQMRLEDLVYCMMVGSANDAAAVIAQHISGSQEAFVEAMNRFAADLGCTATQFMNPHGLHDENQVSTVRDLARILVKAMENEAFMTFFSTVHYTVPATNLSEERDLSSSNFLMNNDGMEIYYDSRVTGGRTGIADDGTRCLATSAADGDLQMVCILVGAKSDYAEDGNTLVYGGFKETTALYDSVFSGYKSVEILYEGQVLRQSTVINGASDVVIGSQTAISAILPEGVTRSDLSFRYTDRQDAFQAPVALGDRLTQVEIWYGNICVAQADLFAMNAVKSKVDSLQQTERSVGASGVKIVVAVVISVLAAAMVLLMILRVVNRMRHASTVNRSKRYRKDRRRSR